MRDPQIPTWVSRINPAVEEARCRISKPLELQEGLRSVKHITLILGKKHGALSAFSSSKDWYGSKRSRTTLIDQDTDHLQ
jgi:hypothetical protein